MIGVPPLSPVVKTDLCWIGKALAWIGTSGAVLSFALAAVSMTYAYAVTSGLALAAIGGATLVHYYCPGGLGPTPA